MLSCQPICSVCFSLLLPQQSDNDALPRRRPRTAPPLATTRSKQARLPLGRRVGRAGGRHRVRCALRQGRRRLAATATPPPRSPMLRALQSDTSALETRRHTTNTSTAAPGFCDKLRTPVPLLSNNENMFACVRFCAGLSSTFFLCVIKSNAQANAPSSYI